jgi:hypothetical protein
MENADLFQLDVKKRAAAGDLQPLVFGSDHTNPNRDCSGFTFNSEEPNVI